MRANQSSIKILTGTEWKDLEVSEKFENLLKRSQFFEGGEMCSTSSIIEQINNEEIYIIGGNQDYPSLVARPYDVQRSCLRVNIKTGLLTVMSEMFNQRWLHDTCSIGHYIFVVGGRTKIGKVVTECERYQTLTDTWEDLDTDCD